MNGSRGAILVLSSLVFAAGCGNSRTRAPGDPQPAAPRGFHTVSYPRFGVAVSVPDNWTVQSRASPLVTTISSGTAIVALWRYPRSVALISTSAALRTRGAALSARRAALQSARDRLIALARGRDATLQLIRSRIETIDGVPAIELDAFERVAGQPRRVRSTHVFTRAAEFVLDEYAPPAIFHTVDHAVFSPLKRSLRLSAA